MPEPATEAKELLVMRMNLVSLHVCVAVGLSNERIEDLANMERPTGIPSRWRILSDGPDPERVPCGDGGGREHVVLTC